MVKLFNKQKVSVLAIIWEYNRNTCFPVSYLHGIYHSLKLSCLYTLSICLLRPTNEHLLEQ